MKTLLLTFIALVTLTVIALITPTLYLIGGIIAISLIAAIVRLIIVGMTIVIGYICAALITISSAIGLITLVSWCI